MGLTFNLVNSVQLFTKKLINSIIVKSNTRDVIIILESKDSLPFFIKFIKTLFDFSILTDIVAVDNLNYNFESRFELIYNILSIKNQLRILVKVFTTNSILSISNIFSNAVWAEREIWDMFGVFFTKNLDLRRILTDYGFNGFPLRKDFPINGYIEVRYNDETSNITYEPLELSQEYRNFNFISPWENLK